MESSPVIQTMLRIGNIHLCKGEVKRALDCFREVSNTKMKVLILFLVLYQPTLGIHPVDIGHWICKQFGECN